MAQPGGDSSTKPSWNVTYPGDTVWTNGPFIRVLYCLCLVTAPFMIWDLFIRYATSYAMAKINIAVVSSIIAINILISLTTWEVLKDHRPTLRSTLAVGFMGAALLMAVWLVFFQGIAKPSGQSHDTVGINLLPASNFLMAVTLALLASRPHGKFSHPLVRHLLSPLAMVWAGVVLLMVIILRDWIKNLLHEGHPASVLFAVATAILYLFSIVIVIRRGHQTVAIGLPDFILAVAILLVGELILILAKLAIPAADMLSRLYELVGVAWILRYVFLVGFREPFERLQVGEAWFRNLFEKSGEITLLLDVATGKIVDGNEAATMFYGYSRQQLKTMHIWDINSLPSETTKKKLSEVAIGQAKHFEYQHRLASGQIRNVDVYATALEIEGQKIIFNVVHDSTERHQSQADLLLFQKVVDSSMNGIIIADAHTSDTPIVYANRAFESLTGYRFDEVRGKNPRLLQGPGHDQTGRAEIRAAIQDKREVRTVVCNYRKDGTAYWCELAVSPVVGSDGKLSHWVGIQNDISARRQAEQELGHMAFFDSLTGIPNRHLFLDRLGHQLALARRTGERGALLYIDLDEFKHVNDTQGHEGGDELLNVLVTRLKEILREVDTLARLGGDEFILLAPGLSPDMPKTLDQIETLLGRVRKVISTPIKTGETDHLITASIGVCIFPQDDVTPSALITQADIAMYRAKQQGRNATCFFDPAMQIQIQERVRLVRDLHAAIEKQDLRMYLQPQVNAEGVIVGAEALIRWQGKDGKMISPANFIPLAEDTGLIIPIGAFILREACLALKRVKSMGSDFRMAVNVSFREFRMKDFVDKVKAVVAATEINPRHLILEVTESVLMDDAKMAAEKMHSLNLLGIEFSIDDFGTGYSSLGYLQNLPLSELKIDRSFIEDAPTTPNKAALVDAILAIAYHHGLRVVAEGIETSEQLEFMKSRGCRRFQGYLFGRPVPGEELLAKLATQNVLQP